MCTCIGLRTTFILCVVFASLWVNVGCTFLGWQGIPDWVEGPSQEFVPANYLLGRGAGDTPEIAAQRAYAAVARIFHAQVNTQLQDNERYSQVEQGDQTTTSRRIQLDHLTQVSTEKVLADVKILDTWHRSDDDQYFVLAGLDRTKTERLLREHILKFDEMVKRYLEDGRTGTDVVTKLRGFKRALRDMRLRQAVNADLQIVSHTGEGIPASDSPARIQQELDAYLLHEVQIAVQVTGDQQPQLSQAIWDGLKQEGLVTRHEQPPASLKDDSGQSRAPSHQKTPDILVMGTSRLEDLRLFDPLFKYVRWCSNLRVIESQGQRVIGAVSRSGREGHITQHEARVRATQAMQKVVRTKMAQLLAKFIYDDQPTALTSSSSSSCLPLEEH
ncbi:MAG: hypothetical protein NPIRA05_12910 [Nitrospirales bacterium]|nr:MAG: hypothetical protein NPIRA05_12910 [Nitrospirales bacterium]